MGNKASKPAKAAGRKFPTRTTGAVPPPTAEAQAPVSRPQASSPAPKASPAKSDAIRADGFDPVPMTNPAFSQRLRQMGIATPNPTLSNSSIAKPGHESFVQPSMEAHYPAPARNMTLNTLEARRRLQEAADRQFDKMADGREFIDVATLRQALLMRGRGIAAQDIEKRLRLKSGVVARLGPQAVVTPLGSR